MSADTKLTGIKAVFFDLFNTLARFWPPREQVQAQACRELGYTVHIPGIDRGYALADALMAEENARKPLRLRSQTEVDVFFARYEQLVLRGGGLEVDLAEAGRIWQRVRQIPYGLGLFEDVPPSLHRLRERGFTTGIISNMNRPGDALLVELGLRNGVHFAITSYEAHAEKPEPAIFYRALGQAGVKASEAVHVGDQVTADVEGARRVGIQPVLMDRYGTAREVPSGCPRVHDMAGLEALLA
jgi:putative hydrolase of the HAD superfamily